jgi:hypothetical protein
MSVLNMITGKVSSFYVREKNWLKTKENGELREQIEKKKI